MRNKRLYSVIIVLALCILAQGVVDASNDAKKEIDFEVRTIAGKVVAFGTAPKRMHFLKTEDKGTYMLQKGISKELQQIRNIDLLVTGFVEESVIEPLAYKTPFDKNISYQEEAVVIGKLYHTGKDLVLVTSDQFVIEVEDNYLSGYDGHKVLFRGRYKKINEDRGSMKVKSHIIIEQ